MICNCGYDFRRASLNALQNDKGNPYSSFVLVSDKEYPAFLEAEVEVLRSKADESDPEAYLDHLRKISESSTYCGTLAICPECSSLVIHWPGEETRIETYPRR